MKSREHQLLYLSSEDVVCAKLEMKLVIQIVEEMFRQKALGLVEMPSKMGIHPSDDSFIHAMPAFIPGMSAAGLKWISTYPHNREMALALTNGQILLNDPRNGMTSALLDCSWVTAARTAAASALSARYLARASSETIGILGCGIQARSHVEAFLCEFPVRRILAYDVSQDALQSFVTEVSETYEIEVSAVRQPRQAVESCDIVLTAGPITQPPHSTIHKDWLQEGACGVSVDYASYWHRDALAQMDLLCTDDVNQYQSHISSGYLRGMPAIELELASLVSGEDSGRSDHDERTFICNLGIALEDVAVAKAVVERAMALGVGTWLSR